MHLLVITIHRCTKKEFCKIFILKWSSYYRDLLQAYKRQLFFYLLIGLALVIKNKIIMIYNFKFGYTIQMTVWKVCAAYI